MRVLLDTQVALWWLTASSRLDRVSRDFIATSSCAVSVASIWEVAIKYRIGKLAVAPLLFRDEMKSGGAAVLPVLDVHAIASADIPSALNDPFDRLLLATAQAEELLLLTADAALLQLAREVPGLPVRQV